MKGPMNRLRHLRRDERGISLLYVTTGFLSIFAATALAVDVGMMVTARSQAQNAADAGALAGAVALALDDFDDRTATGPAVRAALSVAHENIVIGKDVSAEVGDVTFPAAPNGQFNRVRVLVYRNEERANPLTTFISAVFGMGEANMAAGATAHATPANAMTCVRPFTIPDRWVENQDPPWTPASEFRRYNNKGDLVAKADVYIPPQDADGNDNEDYVGYDPVDDKGAKLVLRAGTGNNIQPTFYYSWKMPGDEIGGDYYRENIYDCNHAVFNYGTEMIQEPGSMMGPTLQGVEDLIAQDPGAYWEDAPGCNCAKTEKGRTPRIFPIPLYDPDLYDQGKVSGRNATLIMRGWIGFFVEEVDGNQVIGRITPILGTIDPDAGPAPAGMFPLAVQLVE
jgi:Flp pilus assembly protein TadG